MMKAAKTVRATLARVRRAHARWRRSLAFSLVELAVVLVVVAAIAGAAVTQFGGFADTSKLRAIEREMLAVALAMDSWTLSANRSAACASPDSIYGMVAAS